jgi:amidohydrolase
MNAAHLALVKKLRHQLHRHPELSKDEKWTKARLMTFLRDHTGLEIVDRGPWFYARYVAGEDKKNLAFRAEMDALPMAEGIPLPHASLNPGVSHKCGHDGHAAVLAGLGLELDTLGADANVYLVFQHAEETGEGARVCAALMKEEGIDEIFAFHNMSGMPLHTIGVIEGTAHFASRGMIMRFTGSPTHASQPEHGINPAYAMARIITALPHLSDGKGSQGQVLATVVGISAGSRAFGIAASQGDLLLTIRGEFETELDGFGQAVEDYAGTICKEEGLTVDFSYQEVFPMTANHPRSVQGIREMARDKGFELMEIQKGFRASEDFGCFLKETRGAIFYIGNGRAYPEIHTTPYDFNDEIIETAVEAFKGLLGG